MELEQADAILREAGYNPAQVGRTGARIAELAIEAQREKMRADAAQKALDTLEAMAIGWDVRLRAVPNYTTFNMQLIDPADDKVIASFNGSFLDVIGQADAWFDGVEFVFGPVKVTQP